MNSYCRNSGTISTRIATCGCPDSRSVIHAARRTSSPALLHRLNSDLVRLEGSPQRMHFHAAPEIGRGGCLIKTRFGIIDAQRVTKAGLLRQSLLT